MADQDGKLVSKNHNQSHEEEVMDLRRGPWTVDEDFILINYIAHHGEGRWNSLARCAGLKRTGKSCRLRWLNYLRPDVRRGNITLEEQLLILELHSRWGNRWSKIAQHLPGRTDNEIKNYWRTRVQKHAKQLKCDVNSKQFQDTVRYLWMPRLAERIQAAAAGNKALLQPSSSSTTACHLNITNLDLVSAQNIAPPQPYTVGGAQTYTPEDSSAGSSSDSFGTPVSDLTDQCYNNHQVNQENHRDYYPAYQLSYGDHQFLTTPTGLDFVEQNSQWMDGGVVSDNLWNVDDDLWFLQHQFYSNA